MKAFVFKAWSTLSESFWFIPASMAVLAVVASVFLIDLDRHGDWQATGWVWSGGASGARSMLSTVATSMITVAGTVFSITIAALTLASQQFGPRLLRNFTVDRGNQVVLGTFVATFLYCLMILRTVREQADGHFVPNLSVSVAVLLACASLGVLIYFIHHLSVSIQAENLLASVGRDLKRDLQRLQPPAPEAPGNRDQPRSLPANPPQRIASIESGYIETVDRTGLVAIAERANLVLRLPLRPGDFVSNGETLIESWSSAPIDDELVSTLCGSVQIGPVRTPWQDSRYGIRQLTEIGSRALSPAINDPFTAMGALNWLTDALRDVACHAAPTGIALGAEGRMRLVERPVTFAEVVTLGFEPFRAYGADSVILNCHIMECLARLAAATTLADHREAVLQEARTTLASAEQNLVLDADRRRVAMAFQAVAMERLA